MAATHRRQRIWIFADGETVLRLVMLSHRSNGGHLDNLVAAFAHWAEASDSSWCKPCFVPLQHKDQR